MNKFCPYLVEQVVIHNTIHDARVPHIGLNAIRDNDVIKSQFLPCLKEHCMMYDNALCQCKRTT